MEDKVFVPRYDKAERNHMRRFLQKASPIVDLIAKDRVPWGSPASAELVDSLAAEIGDEREEQMEDEALQELQEDRQVLVNLYGAEKKKPNLPELYGELSKLLRKYGLFDEEVVLLEEAVAYGHLSGTNLVAVKDKLKSALRLREADDASLSESEWIEVQLRRALRKRPLNREEITTALELCSDDAVLYDVATNTDWYPELVSIREKAARLIGSRDYRYALSTHLQHSARTSMILDQFESLKGDELFVARTILTDPKDDNKVHMLIYCTDEVLLMLGWLYVYGARRLCADRLHNMGSRFPEAYEEMSPEDKARCKEELFAHAAEVARDLLSEDEAVRGRISGTASVDSEPLDFFLSFHHPRLALRWWHARKLKNPARVAYVGSWTVDDQIKEALSVKINSTKMIEEMVYGDLSAVDLVFGFRKPEDLTLQDRFLAEIAKNNPDSAIREYAQEVLLRIEAENQREDS
ncbi:MAG: hypothetical protein K6G34_15085 [Lachnospiraceae bacterium]|nr:hypothetical protein [Lachnospiraceae bacterium]